METEVRIEQLDPAAAPESDLGACHRLVAASIAADLPGAPAPDPPSYIRVLRKSAPAGGPRSVWIARRAGAPIGMATITFPELDNTSLAQVAIRVDPAHRRCGAGSALLRRAVSLVQARGRDRVSALGVVVGSDAERWAEARGFTKVLEVLLQTLFVPEPDPAAWQASVPAGYRLEHWSDSAPQDLLAAYAEARGAIRDTPLGDSSRRPPRWTPERVREGEAGLRARGEEQFVTVAVHEPDGSVAALTVTSIQAADPPDVLRQHDTVVVPEHRGRGLGHAVKTAMMNTILTDRPKIRRVTTNVAAENEAMRRVNERLGYVTTAVVADLEAGLDKLGSLT